MNSERKCLETFKQRLKKREHDWMKKLEEQIERLKNCHEVADSKRSLQAQNPPSEDAATRTVS